VETIKKVAIKGKIGMLLAHLENKEFVSFIHVLRNNNITLKV